MTQQNDQLEQSQQPIEPEAVAPILVAPELARLQRTQTLWRAPFGSDGARHYFRKGFNDFYAGYSLWTKSVLPTSAALINWKVEQGEQGKLIALTAREYGSIFHLFVARHESPNDEYQFSINGPSSKDWREQIRAVIDRYGIPKSYIEQWESWLKNDMTAYFRWKREHSVKVLAVEVPVWHDEYKIATPADMVVQCLIKASPYAKAPTVPAVCAVDFKSGENGCDWDEYKLQLGFVQIAWNDIFAGTEYQIDNVFNWAPKKRALSPAGYNFVNQTGRYTEEQIRHYAKTCSLMGFNRPSGGVMVYNDTPDGPELTVQRPHDWLKNFFGNE